VGAAAYLLIRIVPDVEGKPLFEDEAVAFLLTHLVFEADPSAAALRWLSVAFAVGTVLLCYDLGRRLAGEVAGVGAAIVAGASGMLAVYGSFGRMYALFAFVAALAATMFVRALDERTGGAVFAAALAAWLLPAVHPYGGVVVAVEAVVALAVWRGRPLRAALPVVPVALAAVPLAVADFRLANRFEVSGEAQGRLATWDEAWDQRASAVRGFAGGGGWTLAVFLALALGGAAFLVLRRPEFVAWGLLALAAPPVLATLVRTGRAPDLSPRHLIYALPFFAAFVGVAVERAVAWLRSGWQAAALAVLAVIAALSSQGIVDPRSVTYTAALGSEQALAEPAAWLRERVGEGDVLYPYSSVFLAALPEAGEGRSLPRGQAQALLAAVERLELPVDNVTVAIPSGSVVIRTADILERVGRFAEVQLFDSWLLIRTYGPYRERTAVLAAAARAVEAARDAGTGGVPGPLAGWFELNSTVLCEALSTLGAECVSE
jgi:hypothetical protein